MMASANTATGRMTENVQMSLSSIRRGTIWILAICQISFLHSMIFPGDVIAAAVKV
jgi:hypothetical protein